jgi:integration host factor subunit beta
MTKSELIDAVAQRTKITKSRAEQVVNCVFDSMTQAMEQSEGIEIRGFGSFSVREYPPYSGRNPRTGKPVHVAAKRLPFFKVGKELKELVNQPRTNTNPRASADERRRRRRLSPSADPLARRC